MEPYSHLSSIHLSFFEDYKVFLEFRVTHGTVFAAHLTLDIAIVFAESQIDKIFASYLFYFLL
jgi:hypothetical protein